MVRHDTVIGLFIIDLSLFEMLHQQI